MTQISEHQGELTNSMSSRFIPEIISLFTSTLKRTIKTIKNIDINREKMRKNLRYSSDKLISEPLQILLSYYGFQNSYEKIRSLLIKAEKEESSLETLIFEDEELLPFINKFNDKQSEILSNPEKYIGIAEEKTIEVCNYWEEKTNKIIKNL
jgi:adenylosuccinate lyase